MIEPHVSMVWRRYVRMIKPNDGVRRSFGLIVWGLPNAQNVSPRLARVERHSPYPDISIAAHGEPREHLSALGPSWVGCGRSGCTLPTIFVPT